MEPTAPPKRIYLDYASATPVSVCALKAMRVAEGFVGNPGAIHHEGVEAKRALEDARAAIARELGAKSREVVFTSGLTEANNLPILGLARALASSGRSIEGTHWVTSSIEHAAVLEAFAEVERLGGIVTHIDPASSGLIAPEAVVQALRPETVLVSIGWVNNEIGIVQPLRDIARAVKEKHDTALIHSDAGQAPLYLSPQVHTLEVDFLSLGSNKLYGPHGIGALYLSNRAAVRGIVIGGKQERGLRAGTENVALAAGFAAACAEAGQLRAKESKRLTELSRRLRDGIARAIPTATFNGSPRHALPHIVNISLPNISSEYVTLALDHQGFAISTKSACREGEEGESHVVRALMSDAPEEQWRAKNTLRISLGRETTEAQLEELINTLRKIISVNAS